MEKKNTGLIVLVVILSLLVVGLGGYIVYDKVLSKEDSNINNDVKDNDNIQNNTDNNVSKINDTTVIDVNGSETFEEWLDRVSGGDEKIKKLIREKKFLFGGRILSNRGIADRKISLNNCFVVDSPEDSIDGIYNTAYDIAKTFSRGGGCGVNISTLSPRGAKVNNAAETTTGAVSFIDLYNKTSELIGQEGRRKIA